MSAVLAAATVAGEEKRCPVDNTGLVWKGVEAPTLDFNGNKAGRFQMKAITSTGTKVAGHFGKSARNK